MNETRKAIIELIEPYMDKTLSFWCIIKVTSKNDRYSSFWIISADDKEYYRDIRMDTKEYISASLENINKWCDDSVLWFNYKIIGHYNIMVIINYIDKLWYNIHNEQNNWWVYVYKSDWFDKPYLWIIKIKSLNLYTEQEEKELLDLLLKLK